MPYKNNSELPDSVKSNLPSHAQDIFRNAFNSSYEKYGEERAFKIAWAAVQNVFHKVGDKWVEKSIMLSAINNLLNKQFFSTIQDVKKSYDVEIFFSAKNNFEFKKGLEIDIEKIPEEFRALNLGPGRYTYGEITDMSIIDSDNERVLIPDNVISQLATAPYNKIYLAHKKDELPIGKILYSGYVKSFKNPVILDILNEARPDANNIWDSQKTEFLDSYSVSGKCDKTREFNKSTGQYENLVKVRLAGEVSKLGTPGNKNAILRGMFSIAKGLAGTVFDVQGGKEQTMEPNFITKEEFQKGITDIKAEIEKMLKDTFTSFKKELEADKPADQAPIIPPVATPPVTPPVATPPVADPSKPTEEMKKQWKDEVKKELTDEIKKGLLKDAANVPPEDFDKGESAQRKKGNDNDDFMKVIDGRKKSLY